MNVTPVVCPVVHVAVTAPETSVDAGDSVFEVQFPASATALPLLRRCALVDTLPLTPTTPDAGWYKPVVRSPTHDIAGVPMAPS